VKKKKSKNKLEIIENLTKDLLVRFNIDNYEIEASDDLENEHVKVSIKVDEPEMLIGFKGKTLSSFQLILGLMANASLKEYQRILVDINNYRQEQDDQLKGIASEAAKKAKAEKQEMKLLPMTPYERRLVHMVLADDPEIETISEGEGPLRRIVIKLRK